MPKNHVGWGSRPESHHATPHPIQDICPRCKVAFQLVYKMNKQDARTNELVIPQHRRALRPGESAQVKDLPLCE